MNTSCALCQNIDNWSLLDLIHSTYFIPELITRNIKDHDIGEGKRCVIICPDNIRNYITKFVNNDWMYEHGLMSESECMEANIPKLVPHNVWGQEFLIKDINLKPAVFLKDNMTCQEAINEIKNSSYDQFPVKCNKTDALLGMVTSTLLMSKLAN